MKKIFCFWILFLLTVVSAEAAKQPRSFYLTKNSVKGFEALTNCGDGYHMAALWEIFDPSNFKYDTTLGRLAEDSQSGPPSGIPAWIRTSNSSSGTTLIPGLDNCFLWTSHSISEYGTMAGLHLVWSGDSPSPRTDPWVTSVDSCGIADHPVWCVQD